MLFRSLDRLSADKLRFMLLTGARPGEAAGLLVGKVDLDGGRAVLLDTKNRLDHTVVLSSQALEILRRHCEGKKPGAAVFGGIDTNKTMIAINSAAGTPDVTPHKLRHSFASVAAQLVPAFTLRKLLNHVDPGDVAGTHYVFVGDVQLRAAWQTVADFIVGAP